MTVRPFTDASQAQGFVVSQTSNIEAGVYTRRYPSYDYESIVPVVTEGNEWARTVTYYSGDIAGKSEWISGGADDIPFVNVSRDKHEHAFHMRGIGYRWDLEEINVARMLGDNLTDRYANGARFIAERFCYFLAFTGDAEKEWTGLFNDPNVDAVPVAADGSGASTYWDDKDPDKILRDINEALTGINVDTGEVEMADTLLLPRAMSHKLASTRIPDTQMTTLEFLRKNNVYTGETGNELLIRSNRLLATADASGGGRAVAYWRDPQAVRFHQPMPFRFLPPFQVSAMAWEVAGLMRTGGTEVRLPGAVRYIDAIMPPP